MKKTFNLRALEPDMQKVVRRAKKLGAEIQATKHGACVLHLPDDPGDPIYVPKGGGPGTLTDLMDALSRYEAGDRAGAVNTQMPDGDSPEEDDMTEHVNFDPQAFLAHYYEVTGDRDRLQGEVDTLTEERDILQGQVDDLTRQVADAKAEVLKPEEKALLEAAKAFKGLVS